MLSGLGARAPQWILIAATAGAAASALSCGDPGQARGAEGRLARTGEPAMHAVQSEKLRELMGELKSLAERTDYVHALKLEQRQEESLEVARALEKSAADLQARADGLGLDEAERQAFVSLAVKLEKHAKQLVQAARNQDLTEMNTAMSLATATCNGCHALFRGTSP